MRRYRSTGPVVLTALAVAVMTLAIAACGSSNDAASSSETTAAGSSLVGPWTLATYLADGTLVPASAVPADIDLAADGTFTGTTGCNRFSGTWEGTAGGAFTITPGPMTQMACADPAVQAQEAALTTMLPEVAGAEVAESRLTLTDADGATLLTLTAGPEGLVGSYTVTGVNNGAGGVVSSAATETALITFDPSGTVSGNSGCNRFTGTYSLDGAAVTIEGDVASTMMACEPDAQALEEQFLTALGNVTGWERSGTQVRLVGPSGEAQITLVDA